MVYADLAPVGDPGLVAVTLLRALGVTPAAAATAEDQLGAVLRPRRVLLVIDNMEHLVEEGPLLARLLAGAPELHLLVTSRISLGLYGEHQVRVPPLGLPGTVASAADSEAVQLFLQRAEAASSEFKPVKTRWRPPPRSARPWTACRWRSSWRPPGCGCIRRRRCRYYCRRDCPC